MSIAADEVFLFAEHGADDQRMDQRVRTTIGYGLAGVLTALWAAMLPANDARLDLGAARISVVLMVMAAGALTGMAMIGRRRSAASWRPVVAGASLALLASTATPSFAALAATAFALGTALGALNVVLTLDAVAVERARARPVMAALHGTWTVGAVAGGAATAALLGSGAHLTTVAGSGALLVVAVAATAGRPARDVPPPVEPPASAGTATRPVGFRSRRRPC